jgi:uncharacterized Zn-finger protein
MPAYALGAMPDVVPNAQPGSAIPSGGYYHDGGYSRNATIFKPETGIFQIRNTADARRKGPAPFSCPNCDATFTRKHNLENHMSSHEDRRPHLCRQPDCGRSFTRWHDRNRHEEALHGLKVEERALAVYQCTFTYAALQRTLITL